MTAYTAGGQLMKRHRSPFQVVRLCLPLDLSVGQLEHLQLSSITWFFATYESLNLRQQPHLLGRFGNLI